MPTKGKLIVIEGTDGSGKKTQTAKLLERLMAEGAKMASGNAVLFEPHKESGLKNIDEDAEPVSASEPGSGTSGVSSVTSIDFPRYGTPSCYLVEKYLHGGFGNAIEVGPYVASMFYAVDRYDHSFDMRKKMEDGTVIVADRYVSANMGHQAGKIDDLAARDTYLDWLNNLEYEIFKIPRPDLTILLYVDPIINQRLMESRPEKEYLKGKRQDIHEADMEHLRKASEAFLYVAKKFGWTVVDCAPKTPEHPEGLLLPIEEIHTLVWKEVSKIVA